MISVDIGSPRLRLELSPVARLNSTLGVLVADASARTSFGEIANAFLSKPSSARKLVFAASPDRQT
jgi:hypothetical protein